MIDPDFPTLDLTLLPDEPGYISDESIDIILDLTKVGLTSQIEGARQMTTRCGSMLTQSVSLASASIGAACFGLSNASLTGILKPTAILATALTAAGLWTVSAVCCAAGIVGRDFGAPGIDAIDGYKAEVLGCGERQTKLWAIQTMAGTKTKGKSVAASVKIWLNFAIATSIAAPVLAVTVGFLVYRIA